MMEGIFKVRALRMPGFQLYFVLRPTFRGDTSTWIQGVKGIFKTRTHLRLSGIAVLKIDFFRFKLTQKYLISRGGETCSKCHLRAVLCQRSLVLFSNKIQYM